MSETTCDKSRAVRCTRLACLFALAALVALLVAAPSSAQDALSTCMEVRGIKRTLATTLTDLLPREPPATYSDRELRELERRIGNLEIFDSVEVTRDGPCLTITVREKWTIIPEFDLATGTSWVDTYVMLGVTEYNFLG